MRGPALHALLFLSASIARAAGVPSPAELVTIEARIETAAGPGAGVVRVEARVASGWHVNSRRPSEEYLIATEVKLDPAPGTEPGEPRYPEGKNKKFAFADKPLSVYEGWFTIDVPVSWSAAPAEMAGSFGFQACNDTQCLPPVSVRFRARRAGAPSASVGTTAPAVLPGGAVLLSAAPRSAAAGDSRDVADLVRRRGLALSLALVFVWGLGLNLTPCVYPIIPLTVSFFGGQAQGHTRRIVGLATLYVLGMATMYSALGVAAALSGKLFGVALQSPWVLSGVAAALVLLAFSMFGFYDIRMPASWMQKAGARAGAAGAYGMGLLVGVVAAPCIGPVVLGLLTFVAARQSVLLGFLFFFVLSLGLGLPYLFLASFSGSLSRLPRAGAWMEGIKKVFGWVLLAMAAYFLRTVVPGPAGNWLLPAVLLTGAIALAARKASLVPAARVGVASLFVAATIFFMPRRIPTAFSALWPAYSPSQVAAAGRPTIIDFSASWCAPCKELDEKTFSDPRVHEALLKRALFKADLTRANSPEAVALSRQYEILGVPTVVFLDAAGQERRDLRLVGFEEPESFLRRLAVAP